MKVTITLFIIIIIIWIHFFLNCTREPLKQLTNMHPRKLCGIKDMVTLGRSVPTLIWFQNIVHSTIVFLGQEHTQIRSIATRVNLWSYFRAQKIMFADHRNITVEKQKDGRYHLRRTPSWKVITRSTNTVEKICVWKHQQMQPTLICAFSSKCLTWNGTTRHVNSVILYLLSALPVSNLPIMTHQG